jgi:hypothetical protein
VQDDHRFGAKPHGIHDLGLYVELLHRQPSGSLVFRVEHGELAGVAGQANVELTRKPADLRELGATLARLTTKALKIGMAGVWREGGGHPVHTDSVRGAVFEHGSQPLERNT